MAETEAPSNKAATVQVPEHQRGTTAVGSGWLEVSGHRHPYRIFEGVVEYQLKDGTWKEAPASAKRV